MDQRFTYWAAVETACRRAHATGRICYVVRVGPWFVAVAQPSEETPALLAACPG